MRAKSEQKLIKAPDVFVIFLTLSTIFLLFTIPLKSGSDTLVATVTVDGKQVKKINLNESEDAIFTLPTNPEVTLEIKDGKIRFVNSRCPDGTCEKSGFLEKGGDTAACIPAKTVVTVSGESKSDIDAVAGKQLLMRNFKGVIF